MASGEWRLRTFDQSVYGTASDADFLAGKWYKIGVNPTFRGCECPSFYPLPAVGDVSICNVSVCIDLVSFSISWSHQTLLHNHTCIADVAIDGLPPCKLDTAHTANHISLSGLEP
jgi:hypothetical protein